MKSPNSNSAKVTKSARGGVRLHDGSAASVGQQKLDLQTGRICHITALPAKGQLGTLIEVEFNDTTTALRPAYQIADPSTMALFNGVQARC